MICLEDTNVRKGFEGNLEVYESEVFTWRTYGDSAHITNYRFLARLTPKAYVCKNYPVAGFLDEFGAL